MKASIIFLAASAALTQAAAITRDSLPVVERAFQVTARTAEDKHNAIVGDSTPVHIRQNKGSGDNSLSQVLSTFLGAEQAAPVLEFLGQLNGNANPGGNTGGNRGGTPANGRTPANGGTPGGAGRGRGRNRRPVRTTVPPAGGGAPEPSFPLVFGTSQATPSPIFLTLTGTGADAAAPTGANNTVARGNLQVPTEAAPTPTPAPVSTKTKTPEKTPNPTPAPEAAEAAASGPGLIVFSLPPTVRTTILPPPPVEAPAVTRASSSSSAPPALPAVQAPPAQPTPSTPSQQPTQAPEATPTVTPPAVLPSKSNTEAEMGGVPPDLSGVALSSALNLGALGGGL
ncbi:hypothetical protein Cpir12675_004983 [Ceratocystis pirilliformis]|uniref:Uncharacterized protein n=1 Tax=Ceratocystis pirilliformis TaxID=259994 RepID=A0ABR3YSP9_9PEZI